LEVSYNSGGGMSQTVRSSSSSSESSVTAYTKLIQCGRTGNEFTAILHEEAKTVN
jgi:hypothetical protein